MPSCDNFSYMMLNLMGEVGNCAGIVANMISRGEAIIDTMDEHRHSELYVNNTCKWNVVKEELKKKLGDILWQTSGLAFNMGLSLEDVAMANLDNLISRQKREVIDVDNDNQ